MISTSEALSIHNLLIKQFGGSAGLRDQQALTSALSRPFQTFQSDELYPSILHKASALIESIISNHPFIDGNKRTGYVLMRLFLIQNGYDIYSSQEEKFTFVINIASGVSGFDEILQWLQNNTKQY
ncbi:MAG: type II toxin-antitoxin system death-on-curing family toxin [Chitinophagaceae bacterium]